MSPTLRGGLARLRRMAMAARGDPELVELSEDDRAYLTTLHDQSVPLPEGASEALSSQSPRLRELREVYAKLDLPVTTDQSRWRDEAVQGFLDLRYFRGETLIYWHYREPRRITQLKYFLLMSYVRERDPDRLLERLGEDGAFGCWTFSYPGHGAYSRDLLESVNEICFLERELGLSERGRFSVLDIGAGYGRLAHRMSQAYPELRDYCCVDAVPESTFVSEYYLGHREAVPPARVVPLDAIEAALDPGSFDLAVNIHSFSECTHAAIAWWIELLARLRVPHLLLVPNEPDQLLSLEPDRSRRDFGPLLEEAGYRLLKSEPVVDDPAVRELVQIDDRFYLYERA